MFYYFFLNSPLILIDSHGSDFTLPLYFICKEVSQLGWTLAQVGWTLLKIRKVSAGYSQLHAPLAMISSKSSTKSGSVQIWPFQSAPPLSVGLQSRPIYARPPHWEFDGRQSRRCMYRRNLVDSGSKTWNRRERLSSVVERRKKPLEYLKRALLGACYYFRSITIWA